jgi:bifunctional enzyme CysN/CysC
MRDTPHQMPEEESPDAIIARVIAAEQAKSQLRLLTCGSVDDGKSTLLGRTLYDADCVYEDQLARLFNESRGRVPEGDLDFALLLDGLMSEREQGITIDVAWRFFETDKRKFVVADCPGHEQYTRNMATGASQADAALLLIDARKGVLTQTRRHAHVLALMGIRHVAVAVNKMDLVGFEPAAFERHAAEIAALAEALGFTDAVAIPVSALKGDNVLTRSAAMPWFDGPTIIEWLESVDVAAAVVRGPFRMPVQWVSRAGQDFRGYCGRIVGGRVRPGDELMVTRSGARAVVARIMPEYDLGQAVAGQSVTLVLDRDVDVSRGDVLAAADRPPVIADQFQAHLLSLGEIPMIPGRQYLMRLGTDEVPVSITALKHRIDIDTRAHLAARQLAMNELAVVNLAADRPVAFDAYAENRDMGGFVLIDRITDATVGAGMIDFALRRAGNIPWQDFDTTPDARAAAQGQRPAILWFTGLSGAGKSTIANIVDRKLMAAGFHPFVLDGDNVRHGLNRDLGFTEADRVENIRRMAEVAKLMADAGLIVLVCVISPYARDRALAREIAGSYPFHEIFVDAPLPLVEARDPKGLYAKARAGKITHVPGIDAPYEAPEAPELRLTSHDAPAEALADRVLHLLQLGRTLKVTDN